jgi:uncharacterized surface protein with fasciclin (FAS1) repeats
MRVMRRTAIAVVSVAAALTLSACSSSSDQATTAESSAALSKGSIEDADETEAIFSETIVDLASKDPDNFSTLVAAINAAGLVETLNGEDPFTVFAPTNEAFAALPAGVLDALLLPENKDALVKILTYHVVPGTVLAADIADGDVVIATVEGQNVLFSTSNGVTVNGFDVLFEDVIAGNGVIHVIDAVLVPADVDIPALTMP